MVSPRPSGTLLTASPFNAVISTYLPRQDGGNNGNIKAYRIQLSTDGKTWSEPVAEGEFDRGAALKRITFQKPQRARYLRFTALSSQNGLDFASGAEFTVIAE